MADQQVAEWLTSIKLEKYLGAFLEKGYDASVIPDLDDDDLDTIGVTLPGHRKRLLVNALKFQPQPVGAPPLPPAVVPAMPDEAPPDRPMPTEAPPPRPSKKAVPPPTEAPPAPPRKASSQSALPPVPAEVLASRPPARPPVQGKPVPATRPVSSFGPPQGTNPPPKLPQRPQSMAPSIAVRTSATPPPAETKKPLPADSRDLHIVHEATGIMTKVDITPRTSAKQALQAFLTASKRVSRQDDYHFQLLEYFENPPIERALLDNECVVAAQENWPNGVDGCRFIVRELPIPKPDMNKRGKMDKRGGSHKSWKSRFFVLSTAGLQYYPSEKATSKEPLGTWRFDDHLFYIVRQLKKAPRPELGFCIRQKETPLWPTNPKELQESFENGCKFMCCLDEASRADWIASLSGLQQQMHPSEVQVEEEEVEEEEAAPAEEEFVPIKPRPVMGVGIGNVMAPIGPRS